MICNGKPLIYCHFYAIIYPIIRLEEIHMNLSVCGINCDACNFLRKRSVKDAELLHQKENVCGMADATYLTVR